MGLIVDLGYASKKLIADCKKHGVFVVLRLKKGWRPWLLREVCTDGTVFEVEGEEATDNLLDLRTDETDRASFDLDIAFGRGENRVEARLFGVPGPKGGYHWCITLLPRETHPPQLVCKLYRARWEIECDNKRDKSGALLDQIRGEKMGSVIAIAVNAGRSEAEDGVSPRVRRRTAPRRGRCCWTRRCHGDPAV